MKKVIKPTDKKELKKIIDKEIALNGSNCDLNFIDTSLITDMSYLFSEPNFNGSISQWNTSNVVDMSYLFYNSIFNSSIDKWDVNRVREMTAMFTGSQFNQDISKWDVREVADMRWMFAGSDFDADISNWNVSKVTDISFIFSSSKFNQSIENWTPISLEEVVIDNVYQGCSAPKPSWLIEDKEQRNLYLKTRAERKLLSSQLASPKSVLTSKNEIFKL